MNMQQYRQFVAIRETFRQRVQEWTSALPGLRSAQLRLAMETAETDYAVETAIVYNRALDEVTPGQHIAWIIVADNPGKREQEASMNRYLVGRSGLQTERFFARELGVDIRQETLIINKTPIHTPKTAQLRRLVALYPEVKPILDESQRFMAGLLWQLRDTLGAPVWIMGLSELGRRGLFRIWSEAVGNAYRKAPMAVRANIHVLKHFSMGAFATAIKYGTTVGETTGQAALRIGLDNARNIWWPMEDDHRQSHGT
jgi:hypothetical protein